MLSIKHLSVLAAATSFMSVASAAWSSSSVIQIPSPTATVDARTMETIGCFKSSAPLDDHGEGPFTSPGSCQQICLGLKKDVLGLSEGNRCWCGDSFPALDSKTTNSSCNTGCAGGDNIICGGRKLLWVMTTGKSLTTPEYYVDDSPVSSSSSKSSAIQQETNKPTSTAVELQTNTPSAAPKSGPNTAGIAAGVVVGVVVLASIIGGVFFFLRHKKRRQAEDDYRNRASVNNFVAGGKMHTSNSSMTDSRLDPEFMARRQSNGSIADNEDYSRRILKVTNA